MSSDPHRSGLPTGMRAGESTEPANGGRARPLNPGAGPSVGADPSTGSGRDGLEGAAVVPPTSPDLPRLGRDRRIQLLISLIVVVASWISIRPLGLVGVPGVITVLLAANTVLIAFRHLPDRALGGSGNAVVLTIWSVLSAALLSFASLSFAPAFAYMAVGSAGYRLSTRPALVVAGATGALSALGLQFAESHGIDGWPAVLGLTVALPVFLGMANRSREEAIVSAFDAARAGQRAAESEAKMQALAERARISRDIHDVLAHSLSGVSMQLQLSEMMLDRGDLVKARVAIAKANSMVREGMVEAGRAVQALRADALPLAESLRALFADTAPIEVVGPEREVSTEVSQTLLRAAQEALTNARRHAPGASILATLRYLDDTVQLEVGNGRPAQAGQPSTGSGMGLVGMRERASLLGGRADAGPIVGGAMSGGWRVQVTLPV